jgi:hypothetical protein
MSNSSLPLRDLCEKTALYFENLSNPLYNKIIADLRWCIGSYDNDYSPVGLYEYGENALILLNEYLKENPDEIGSLIVEELKNILNPN